MSNQLLKELRALVKHGVIDEVTASKIETFYLQGTADRSNRLITIFSVLGAFLVGLGTILIVAHNWDSFSKMTRLVFAAMPLLISQIACISLVSKKSVSVAAREATGGFIVLSVGAFISLVSQIYNVQGDLAKFLLVWTLLAIPVIYALESSVASMLAWIGATAFVLTAGYNHSSTISPFYYLLLAILILPHFIAMIRNEASFNFKFSHHWIVPISLTIAFAVIDLSQKRFLMLSYVGLFGVFVLFSQLNYFSRLQLLVNGFLVIGNLGTVYLLLSASFEPSEAFYSGSIDAPLVAIGVLYLVGLFFLIKEQGRYINPTTWCFPVFALIFLLGSKFPDASRVLFNLSLLLLAIVIILDGTRKNNLGILNYGLIIISALIVCRFFDTEVSFVLRGLIFILVGAGFFGFNYWIIKKSRVD